MSELTQMDKILMIEEWFGERPDINFNMSFVNKMKGILEMDGELTENQEGALDNICNSWHII